MTSSTIILGANAETAPLVECAKKHFDQVYVVDPYSGSFCKSIDGVIPVNINPKDIDALSAYCVGHNIDSILLGVADRLVEPYAKLCQRLNKPSCLSSEAASVLSNKLKFSAQLQSYDMEGIPNLAEEQALQRLKNNEKTVVKPADGNSSKGLTIIDREDQLTDAISEAKRYSASQTILIEPFMDSLGLGIYLTFDQGECINYIVYDRVESKGKMGSNNLPIGSLYPSALTTLYYETIHHQLVKLLQNLGFRHGPIMFSAYVERDQFFVYDPGARLQGEGADVSVQFLHGIDQKLRLIEFAKQSSSKKDTASRHDRNSDKLFMASVWVYLSSGQISVIEGLNFLKEQPWCHEIRIRLKIGDEVKEDMLNTEASVFCRIYIQLRSRKDYVKIAETIFANISIKCSSGAEMVRDTSNILKKISK